MGPRAGCIFVSQIQMTLTCDRRKLSFGGVGLGEGVVGGGVFGGGRRENSFFFSAGKGGNRREKGGGKLSDRKQTNASGALQLKDAVALQ